MALAAPKVQCSKFKVQSYEEGNLEIHHSDSSGHLDRHRHQPGSHQLHLLRKGAHPLPLPRGGVTYIGYYFKDGSNTPTIYQDHPLNFNLSFGLRFNLK